MKRSTGSRGYIILVCGILLIPLVFYVGLFQLFHIIPAHVFIGRTKLQAPTVSFKDIQHIWPKNVPILMYHYVENVQDKGDTMRQSLAITPYTFEKQIQTLVNGGYTCLTASELGDVFDGKKELPARSLLITFDDGYRDFYTDAYPILKKYHVKATVYVIAGYVGYKNYMTEKQLQEIVADGIVEIGAHTVHHINLRFASNDVVKTELIEGKTMLEQITHTPVVSFAYPDGQFSEYAQNVVQEAGYKTAVSTTPGIEVNVSNRYMLNRIRTGDRIGTDLLTRISKAPVAMY